MRSGSRCPRRPRGPDRREVPGRHPHPAPLLDEQQHELDSLRGRLAGELARRSAESAAVQREQELTAAPSAPSSASPAGSW
ncbi:hypothetical protein ACFQ1I_25145 [Kitasatospora arboriphila]